MAISEDTAPLVAAQLTSAWIQRVHVNELPNTEAELLEVYRRFKERIDDELKPSRKR